MKEAGIETVEAGGSMLTIQNGVWFEERDRDEHYKKADDRIGLLDKDCNIREFMAEHFPVSEYEALVKNVTSFSEGFGLAAIRHASVISCQDLRPQNPS